MLKKLGLASLMSILAMGSLNAQEFKKGDTVIVPAGAMMCFDKNVLPAADSLAYMDSFASILIEEKTWEPLVYPKDTKQSEYCANFNTQKEYVFERYEHYSYKKMDKRYAILDSKDHWIATYSSVLRKGKAKPKSTQPTYTFLGIDDLEAFPSDYVGKLSYLKCKRSTPTENKNGGYKIMSNCANEDGKYGFGSNNPFKIQIQTSSKDTARSIAKSKRKVKWFLGTVKQNPEQYAIAKHIFVINEVQFK